MPTTREAVTADMEARFGSDLALGVWFQLEDGRRMTASDYDALATGAQDAPAASSYLPHGGSACCCTDYAIHIFRALPGRVRIFGFANQDNPTSRVARELLHPGGHDFALVDNRFIVDPWPRLVPGEFDQMVFDLHHECDAALALDIYGPQACWAHMALAEAGNDSVLLNK